MTAKHTGDRRAEDMVQNQIISRGIGNRRVLDAMRRVPRECFLPPSGKGRKSNSNAYGDYPIPIGCGQTISQPYIVAYMTDRLDLRANAKVLEIGTGSGYQTAVLAELCQKVYSVERIAYLLKNARKILTDLGYENIEYQIGDGLEGWAEQAPFDGILVTAAVPGIPDVLKQQLADNGRMVTPVGDYRTYQILTVVERIGNRFDATETIGCRFVPCIGKKGF